MISGHQYGGLHSSAWDTSSNDISMISSTITLWVEVTFDVNGPCYSGEFSDNGDMILEISARWLENVLKVPILD